MILLALCLIQASADNYYYKLKLYNKEGQLEEWTTYIRVGEGSEGYTNGLSKLVNGETVRDELGWPHSLPKTADNKAVDFNKIYGIVFANGKGRFGDKGNKQENILQGAEWTAWLKICSHIKHLELREYKRDTYNNSGYFMGMSNLEVLELPKEGMTVEDGDEDGQLYFANAYKLKKILIYP